MTRTARRTLPALFMLTISAVMLSSCTIPETDPATGNPAAEPATETVVETATETSVQTETETTTIAETTIPTTVTRWAVGDPADNSNPNERLFGPYPDEDACTENVSEDCEEREDGWYLVVPAADSGEEPEEGQQDGESEPSEGPSNSEPAQPDD